MTTGIGATITTLTDGTTAHAADVMASLNSLNSNGVSNDGGQITTGGGNLTAVSLHTTGGGALIYIFATTVLISNDSIGSGSTKTYTCVGVGSVPTGAKAVLLSYYYTSSAGNTFAAFTPHGTAYTTGNAPASDPATSTSAIGNAGAFIVPLDATGKIDVAASNGAISGLYIYLYGYIY